LLQYLLLSLSPLLVALLIFRPALGLDIFWNILIPVAPALVVVAPGLWRNICPLATLSLLPQHLGISKQMSLSRRMVGVLSLLSLMALFVIVPYRHLSLDTNGLHTALMLIFAGLIAFAMGMAFKWRSGWCTTLCPIHPVERLYGFAPSVSFTNSRCSQCERCTSPCPDSTKSMTPAVTGPDRLASITGHFLIGSFAGFIWGWNQVPDFSGTLTTDRFILAYLWPLASASITLTIYVILRRWLVVTKTAQRYLIQIFATAAVVIYYWYRIPALIGFGVMPETGILYDLSSTLPPWSTEICQLLSSAFFIWFMLIRKHPGVSWMIRPPLIARHSERASDMPVSRINSRLAEEGSL
jgi:hypothetical protein